MEVPTMARKYILGEKGPELFSPLPPSLIGTAYAMARPGKIRIHANRKVTALSTESALDRFNPGVKAAREDEQTISIYNVIGDDPWGGEGVTVKRIDAALRSIGNRDVTVNINSPGGDVFEGIAIYNRLREHQGKVNVKVLGLAASAASIIAMAGDRVEIGASSFLMIHNAWVLAIGNRHDMREVSDFLEPFDRALADVYVARSGQEMEAVQAAMDAETWMNGSQAVELGYADALLASDEIEEDKAKAEGSRDVNAVRRVEAALCHEMPRSAARDLINQIKGKSGAAPEPATPDAGDPDFVNSLASLLASTRA
jgi:ATP-dependent Clp protease, protease subunit